MKKIITMLLIITMMVHAQKTSRYKKIYKYKRNLNRVISVKLIKNKKGRPYPLSYAIYYICKKAGVRFLYSTSKKYVKKIDTIKIRPLKKRDKAKNIIQFLLTKHRLTYAVTSKGVYLKIKKMSPKEQAMMYKYWEQAKTVDCVTGYQEFLRRFPHSKFAKEAKRRLSLLSKDYALWEKCNLRGQIQDYKYFIQEYPQSPYAKKARRMIEQIQREKGQKAENERNIKERIAARKKMKERYAKQPEQNRTNTQKRPQIRAMINFSEAVNTAKANNKLLFILFTGSDWCPACVAFKRNILSHVQFQQYLNSDYIVLYLDFPKRKKLPARLKQQNESLAKSFGIRGFPTVILFNPKNMKPVGKMNYNRNAKIEQYIGYLKNIANKYK